MSITTDEKYWAEYDGLQHVKHQLLKRYLGGWFPILCSWNGRVLYVDCNAGRGRHKTGQEGSPILALNTLLNHQYRSKILKSTIIGFIFFENNQKNYQYLCEEIKTLGVIPSNIYIKTYPDDYESQLLEVINDIKAKRQQLAPSFIFVDPYGFSLSMDLLNNLLAFPNCEILINFMYRYVDMAIHQPAQTENLDRLFGDINWNSLIDITDSDERAKQTISFFSKQLNARHVTHMLMIGENNVIKYALIHATNHPRGREVFKDAMWHVSPDGIFKASERRNPDQLVLIQSKPDLNPLKEQLWNNFLGQQVEINKIYSWLVNEIYRETHLHQVLTEYREHQFITYNGGFDRIAFTKNPIIGFPKIRPSGS